MALFALSYFLLFATALGQVGLQKPLVHRCGPKTARIACVNRYAAVMPYPFYRDALSWALRFEENSIRNMTINDTAWEDLVFPADIVVFDKKRSLPLLGDSPTVEFLFNVSGNYHEAPVYVPKTNKIYSSQLKPPGFLPQYVIDLNKEPPTIGKVYMDPPLYAPNDAQYVNGSIIWAVAGGNKIVGDHVHPGPIEQRPGLYKTDPTTLKTTTLLNNYYGMYFNGLNDLAVHKNGDIWFTDTYYAWWSGLTDTAPQKNAAVYRFRPSTGATSIISETLTMANGIEFSPDCKTLYLTDSGSAGNRPIIAKYGHQVANFNNTGHVSVYAFDVKDEMYITNGRPIYQVQSLVPDGIKVAANGLIVTTTGYAVDVFDHYGTVLFRVATNFTVNNIVFAGPNLTELWMTGVGGIARARLNWAGQPGE